MNTDNKIPQTDSIQELAKFWDSHDLTAFEGQLEEVKEPVFERDALVEIRLQSVEIEAVEQVAKEKGINHAELIREWILEKIPATQSANR